MSSYVSREPTEGVCVECTRRKEVRVYTYDKGGLLFWESESVLSFEFLVNCYPQLDGISSNIMVGGVHSRGILR